MENLRAILNESIVDDTAGIDRSTATLASSTWPAWDRWSFRMALLRLRVLPSLDAHARASEIVVALFYGLPIVLAAAAPWLIRSLPNAGSAGRLAAFAAFAFLVDLAMLRSPFPARAPDAVVLSAIVFGCCLGALWKGAGTGKTGWRVLLRGVAVAVTVFVLWNVATVGRFGERVSGLAGQWSSLERARAAWTDVSRELAASPPLSHFYTRRAGLSIRMAAYVRECVPPSERLLVLWFAPDIYYYSGRLMAQRHLVFIPEWSALQDEQQHTLDKIRRFAPPVVLAQRSSLASDTKASYPGVVSYVEQAYDVAASVADGGRNIWCWPGATARLSVDSVIAPGRAIRPSRRHGGASVMSRSRSVLSAPG